MATVMMLVNVLASVALVETSVPHVARIFLDFHNVKVFVFSIFQKTIISLYYPVSFIGCDCHRDGSLDGNCDDAGKCHCKFGIEGDKCNTCAKTFDGFPHCRGIFFCFL